MTEGLSIAGRRALGASPAGPAPAFTSFIPSKEGAASSPSVPPSNPMFPFMTLKPYLPTKPANPFTPSFVPDPQIFVDKKAELLNNLFSSPMMFGGAGGGPAAASGPSKRALGPTGPAASWAGMAPGGVSPWAPAPGGASPWAPAPVDPTVFTDKKADFLSKLFSGLGTGKAAAGGAAPGMVPPGFWMPLPPTPPTTPAPVVEDDPANMLKQLLLALAPPPSPATPPILLAPSPTPPKMIVPPSYWIPSGPMAGPGSYMKKVSDYLDKLFESLNTTSATPVDDTPSVRSVAAVGKVARHHNDNNNDWVPQTWERALTAAAATPDNTASSPLAAKDLVVSSILSQVGELKTAMLDTLNEMMLKQKELAAAAVVTKRPPIKFGPFPWGPTPKPTPDPTEPYQKRLETIGQVFDMLTSLGQEVATGGGGSAAQNVTTVAPAIAPARTARSLEGGMRSVQMAVHQGYQSMPAGTEEVISAGAGRDPSSAHEGGGVNLKVISDLIYYNYK